MKENNQYAEYDESYTESQLQHEQDWYIKHNEELTSLRHSINLFLKANNVKSIYELCLCFNESSLIDTYGGVPDIAYCLIAIGISMNEFNQHITNTLFLLNVSSIEELISKVNKYKFLILNIEFNTGKITALETLINDLTTNKLSYVALVSLINIYSINKELIFNELCQYMKANNYNELHSQLTDTFNSSNN